VAASNRHYELKKLLLFIEFTFIGHTNLKFGERKKQVSFEISILLLLGLCCTHTTLLHPPGYVPEQEYTAFSVS
jgi:hypothetical protein